VVGSLFMTISSLDQLQALVGQPAGSSEWVTVGQDDICRFGALTGDEQWIHVDTNRASTESPWGTTVAHGFLTLSLLSRLAFDVIRLEAGQSSVVNYGLNKVRFPAPVRAGSRVRGHFVLLACGPVPGGLELVWKVTVDAENEPKPVCVAEWIWRVLAGTHTRGG